MSKVKLKIRIFFISLESSKVVKLKRQIRRFKPLENSLPRHYQKKWTEQSQQAIRSATH